MGAQVCPEEIIDKETDPEVAARRNKLFNQYVAPYYNMIYKLCIRYSYKSQNVQENYIEVLINFSEELKLMTLPDLFVHGCIFARRDISIRLSAKELRRITQITIMI